jgi:hypothetical protein
MAASSFQNFVFESDALRVVLRKLCFGGVLISEHLEMLDIPDLLAGVDVDKNSHWSLFSFRLPQ